MLPNSKVYSPFRRTNLLDSHTFCKGSERGLERTPGCHKPARGWTPFLRTGGDKKKKTQKTISEDGLISALSDRLEDTTVRDTLAKRVVQKYGNSQTCSDPRSPHFSRQQQQEHRSVMCGSSAFCSLHHAAIWLQITGRSLFDLRIAG